MRTIVPSALLVLSASLASAQTGQLDQYSPYFPDPAANFQVIGASPTLTWQQEVRAGLAGTLEGFVLQLTGLAGQGFNVSIRLGPAWNTGPSVFQSTALKTNSAQWQNVFVDTRSAGIALVPGTLFVIQLHTFDSNTGFTGSWIAAPAPPHYSQPLFLNGACHDDCQYRIGFETWVVRNPGAGYCFGDTSGTACPCGNAGVTGYGCANSLTQAGAHLFGSGAASIGADTLVLGGSGIPNGPGLYFQGTLRTAGGAGTVFGDGLQCASGTITRLGTKVNFNGISSYPGTGDAPISIKGGNTAGAVRQYQCWYRNAAAFCTASTFNLTNALEVTWAP